MSNGPEKAGRFGIGNPKEGGGATCLPLAMLIGFGKRIVDLGARPVLPVCPAGVRTIFGKENFCEQRASPLPSPVAAADQKRRRPGGAHPPSSAGNHCLPPLGGSPPLRPSGTLAPSDRHPLVVPAGRPIGPGSSAAFKPRHPISPESSQPLRRSHSQIRIGRMGERFPQMHRLLVISLGRWTNGTADRGSAGCAVFPLRFPFNHHHFSLLHRRHMGWPDESPLVRDSLQRF